MNAIGPTRYMFKIARSARTTLHVHVCACGATKAAVLRLPEVFYGTLAAAVRIECQGVKDTASRPRVSLTVPTHPSLKASTKASAPATYASRFPSARQESVRTPFTLGSGSLVRNSPAALVERDTQLHPRYALALSRPPAWRQRDLFCPQ